jgi:YD repeat-containing protein
MEKFADGTAFDWDDLGQLVRRTQAIDPGRITADCINGFAFLADMSPDEEMLAGDAYQHERTLWERLRNDLPET